MDVIVQFRIFWQIREILLDVMVDVEYEFVLTFIVVLGNMS